MYVISISKAVIAGIAACWAGAALGACTPEDEAGLASAAGAALDGPPPIELYSPGDYQRQRDHLQLGNDNDAYWVDKNVWGAGSLIEGTAPDQYEQSVGIYPPVGPGGEVAYRMKWRWPQGTTEVKAYPAVLSGRKPGHYSTNYLVDGRPIRLLDGSYSTTAPSGHTPGTSFPVQLPVPPIKAKLAYGHLAPPTGRGQLTFDLWLQSQPGQDTGWGRSSITHEIMIPLTNWGRYGAYPDDRNPAWYDHDAVIGGRLFHVYCTKGSDGQLRYDFGGLDGTYGRYGWKMIAFVPDVMPLSPDELDLSAFINYLATRSDVAGMPWAQGNEYLVSVELGVEPEVGTGDIVVYNYKVGRPQQGPAPAPQRVQAEAGALSGSGVGVRTDLAGYEGSGFVGTFTAAGDRATVSFTNVVAGTYDLRVRYHAGGTQENDVVIGGAPTWEARFPGTGTGWGIKTLRGVTLTAGTNTVAIVKGWGYIDVDYLEIVPSSPDASDTATKKQLENGSLTGVKITEPAGFEGRGAVGWFASAGDRAAVTFTGVAAGTYDVRVRYQSGGNQVNSVLVNGVARSVSFPATGSGWAIATVANVALAAGSNTIAIAKDWGWIAADSIEIVPAAAP